MKRKHGLLLFAASCIPGCGEMYQGYMKRGVSILTAFCGLFALGMTLDLGALVVLMLPLWLFSFFDSYDLRSRIDGEIAPPDGYLFGLGDLDAQRLDALLSRRHSLLGWGLVLLGCWLLYTTAADGITDLLSQFFDVWWLRHILLYTVPRLALTVGIIALGVWFIRGPRRPTAEDIPAFTPPVEEESGPAAAEEEAAPQEAGEVDHGEG